MGSMSSMLGALAMVGGSFFATDALRGEARAGTIEDLRVSKTLRLAYDEPAPTDALYPLLGPE